MGKLIRRKEASAYIGIQETRLLNLTRQGKVKALNVSTNAREDWMYKFEDLDRFINGLPPLVDEPELPKVEIKLPPPSIKTPDGKLSPEWIARYGRGNG